MVKEKAAHWAAFLIEIHKADACMTPALRTGFPTLGGMGDEIKMLHHVVAQLYGHCLPAGGANKFFKGSCLGFIRRRSLHHSLNLSGSYFFR